MWLFMGQKKVAEQITGKRSQETLPAVLGLEYLAAAGRGLPAAAATVRSANGLSSEISRAQSCAAQ